MRFLRAGTILYFFSFVLLLWILFLALDYIRFHSPNSEVLENVPVLQIPRKRNIIFIESSCAVDKTFDYKPLLTNRQACAIESAARANPQYTVFYFFTCLYHEDVNLRIVEQQALSYSNVKAVQINTDTVFMSTPLDAWYFEGELFKNKYSNIYAKEVLKALLLWKYGGIYLDLDFIIMRSLGNLENFVVRGEGNKLEFSVLGLDSDGIGNQISSAILDDIRNSFKPNDSSSIGSDLLFRAMEDLCGVSMVNFMTPDRCEGVTVLPTESFIPLQRRQSRLYVSDTVNNNNYVMELIRDCYGTKMWEERTNSTKVVIGSNQPYSSLAAEYCPKVFQYSGSGF